MEQKYNIEEVGVGDVVEFIIPTNKATCPVKEVDLANRRVKINFFEDPIEAIDRVDKWVGFDNLYIFKKADVN